MTLSLPRAGVRVQILPTLGDDPVVHGHDFLHDVELSRTGIDVRRPGFRFESLNYKNVTNG